MWGPLSAQGLCLAPRPSLSPLVPGLLSPRANLHPCNTLVTIQSGPESARKAITFVGIYFQHEGILHPMHLLRDAQRLKRSGNLQQKLAQLLCDTEQAPEFASLRRTIIYGVGEEARRREIKAEVRQTSCRSTLRPLRRGAHYLQLTPCLSRAQVEPSLRVAEELQQLFNATPAWPAAVEGKLALDGRWLLLLFPRTPSFFSLLAPAAAAAAAAALHLLS